MNKMTAIGTVGGKRQTGPWGAIHNAASKASLAVVYAMMGLAGVLLWVMVHLPVGGRAREALAYAMVGCVGLFTLGWQMMRAQLAGQRRN